PEPGRQKDTQAQATQQDKMASLGQLVTGIAHEINNPLAFVVNNLYVVETALDSLSPEMEKRFPEESLVKLRKARLRLAEMKQGLDRVQELVLNVRTFSRLDKEEFTDVDVVAVIDSVLLLLDHRIKGRIRVERNH